MIKSCSAFYSPRRKRTRTRCWEAGREVFSGCYCCFCAVCFAPSLGPAKLLLLHPKYRSVRSLHRLHSPFTRASWKTVKTEKINRKIWCSGVSLSVRLKSSDVRLSPFGVFGRYIPFLLTFICWVIKLITTHMLDTFWGPKKWESGKSEHSIIPNPQLASSPFPLFGHTKYDYLSGKLKSHVLRFDRSSASDAASSAE